jgi:hypothetical protein
MSAHRTADRTRRAGVRAPLGGPSAEAELPLAELVAEKTKVLTRRVAKASRVGPVTDDLDNDLRCVPDGSHLQNRYVRSSGGRQQVPHGPARRLVGDAQAPHFGETRRPDEHDRAVVATVRKPLGHSMLDGTWIQAREVGLVLVERPHFLRWRVDDDLGPVVDHSRILAGENCPGCNTPLSGTDRRATVPRLSPVIEPEGPSVLASEESALQMVIDQQAIADLLYRYSDIVTRGAWDEDASLFVDHAVVAIAAPFSVRLEGADAIRAWRAGTDSLELLFHTTFSPSIRILANDRAYATSQTAEMVRGPAVDGSAGRDAQPVNTFFRSIYYDDIVKLDGAWRFAHRRCRPVYLESGVLVGETLAARATLERYPD